MRRVWLKRILIALPVILVVLTVGFVGWAGTPAGVLMPSVEVALTSSESVSVTTEPWLTFTPAEPVASVGFIFYPGGRVLPEAYAPTMRAIAESGYRVVVPAMPLNLAVFAPNKADEIIAAFPEITAWVIGGHSLGGAMAATYAAGMPDRVGGLVLWASYAQDSTSLADFAGYPVSTVYATNDGLLDRETFDATLKNLPADAEVVIIEGGNHAQFGDYGDQDGDMPAEIDRDTQQAQAVASVLAVLARVEVE